MIGQKQVLSQTEVEAFIGRLPDAQRVDAFGYALYFVGGDRRLPFATIASSDSEFDNVSNLEREGVYRLNIGVSKETFRRLFGEREPQVVGYTELDVFMPHPHYSRQYFICILNPSGDNAEKAKRLVEEAHSIAAARWKRKQKSS